MEPIELQTARLRLRQWRASDSEPFAALNADPRVMEFFPDRLTAGASDVLLEALSAATARRGWGLWAVELKREGLFMGFVGLAGPAPSLPLATRLEIAWRLDASYWGQGYATEAASAVIQAGSEGLQLPEIVAYTAVLNQRSRRLMKRLGMSYAGRFEHPELPVKHRLRPHVVYRLSRESWCGANRGDGA